MVDNPDTLPKDTVAALKAEISTLRAEFEAFKSYAKPVIDAHQPSKLPPQEPARMMWPRR